MTNSPLTYRDTTDSYGTFDDAAREYVILTPKTPYPWINYLGNRDFFGMISNTGGGYCFYRDAKLRRLTRYRYNGVPVDQGGRYFYLRDGDRVWSPSWRPAATDLDQYVCRHGLGYTRFQSALNDLEAELTCFVPLDTTAEVHHLRLHNRSRQTKSISVTSFVEWCLWNAQDDMSNFQRNYSTGEVEVDRSTIYHKTEYRERRDHYAFYSVNRPIDGFDTDRDAFLGDYNGFALPDAVRENRPRGSLANGWAPIASHHLELILAPDDVQDLVFVLGYVANDPAHKWDTAGGLEKTQARAMIARFAGAAEVDAALEDLRAHWDGLLGRFSVSSPDAALDRSVNIWNQYQCIVTFHMSRSASLFESGVSRGMGFRDSNQDLLGVVHSMPERARERIRDLAAVQYADGSADHQYQPLTKRGNAEIGSGFNDDPLWLILATAAYVKETGDVGFLEASVPFSDAPERAATLFDHLHASFDHVVANLGPHGLPLIGRADWNDCLNLNCFSTNPDESFQTTVMTTGGTAESVMIAGLFVTCGRELIALCRHLGREVAFYEEAVDRVESAVREHGWDGRWFLRAYRHDGDKVGSCENREGQIYVEPQGWCVMAGIGLEDGRAERALDSVAAFLECDDGVVVLYPAYSRYDPALGEISSYPEGYKENGSVFCHTNPWIVIAETMLGRGNRAYDLFRRFSPTWRERHQARHKTEPYVYAQMISGKQAARPGEAKNSWLTGTAAWAFYAVSRHILGIRPTYDGLLIDPCIPREWTGFQVERSFRGATYRIHIENPGHASKGVVALTVDGKPQAGNLIPCFPAGTTHTVTVTLGRGGER